VNCPVTIRQVWLSEVHWQIVQDLRSSLLWRLRHRNWSTFNW